MKNDYKKILITGGAGFIGSEIVEKLYNEGNWHITVLDQMSEQIHGTKWESSYLYHKIKNKCKFIYGSVCDLESVQNAINGCEYIIHLAAETGTGQSMYQINRYNQVNIMGLSNIFQAISLMGGDNTVRKIILSSSRSVYGEGKYECPNCGVIYPHNRSKEKLLLGDYNLYCPKCGEKLMLCETSEDSEINPCSLYAYTKYAQERMIQTMCPALGLDYTIFRFQNVYGVGQSLKNPYTGILSIFSTLMLENKPVNIFEDGLESRDFINVKDVAECVVKSIESSKSFRQIFNLGSGINTSVLDVAKILKKNYNSSSDIKITGDFRLGDIAHNKADIKKVKKALGLTELVSLDDGLKEFCDWVLSQELENTRYDKSLLEMENAGMLFRNHS